MSDFADWLGEQGIVRDHEIDLLFVSPTQFHAKPQIGTPRRMEWSAFAHFLSAPSFGDSKDVAGGFACGSYSENVRRKANLIAIGVLVIDVDGGGDVDLLADELGLYDCVVLETFSSTSDDPRARVLLRLAEPVDAQTYEDAHAVVRGKLRSELGAQVDDGAKDASRLSYLPVRRPDAPYRFRVNVGRGLDAPRVAALLPKKPPPRPVVLAPEHVDKYIAGALRRAADAISMAADGARHETLNREAYALARLGVSEVEIRNALLPAAVAAMGEPRRSEAVRTIADAVRARRGVA